VLLIAYPATKRTDVMSDLRFVDTNILLYSISSEPSESAKRDLAIKVLDREDLAVSVQVLQEFYVQATRATRTDAIPHELAVALIRTWMRFKIQDVTLSVMNKALSIKERHKLSYWDAAIVAAAHVLECREILSEDLGHGREIEGLRITNPFR
jgi:predicted nucleic acid-binding protein